MPTPKLSSSEKVLVNDIKAINAHLEKYGDKILQFASIFSKTVQRRQILLPDFLGRLKRNIVTDYDKKKYVAQITDKLLAVNEIYEKHIPAIRADLDVLLEKIKSPEFAKLVGESTPANIGNDDVRKFIESYVRGVSAYADLFKEGGVADGVFSKLASFTSEERKLIVEAKNYEATKSRLEDTSARLVALFEKAAQKFKQVDKNLWEQVYRMPSFGGGELYDLAKAISRVEKPEIPRPFFLAMVGAALLTPVVGLLTTPVAGLVGLAGVIVIGLAGSRILLDEGDKIAYESEVKRRQEKYERAKDELEAAAKVEATAREREKRRSKWK